MNDPFYAYITEQTIINMLVTFFLVWSIGPRKNGRFSERTNALCMMILYTLLLTFYVTGDYFYSNIPMYHRYAHTLLNVPIIIILLVFLDGSAIKKLITFLTVDFVVLPSYLVMNACIPFLKRHLYAMEIGNGISLFYIGKLLILFCMACLTLYLLRKPIVAYRKFVFPNNGFLWGFVIFAYSIVFMDLLPNMWYGVRSKVLFIVWLLAICLSISCAIQFNRLARLKQEKYYYTLQKTLMTEYELSLKREVETTRKLRHDIANHIQTLQALKQRGMSQVGDVTPKNDVTYHTGEREDVSLIYDNITENLGFENNDTGNVLFCDNLIVQTALLNKVQECKQNHIDLQMDMREVALEGYSEMDLLGLLYNLFDNAIEACEQMSDVKLRMIRFSCYRENQSLHIRILNSKSSAKKTDSRFRTTKKDKKRHGVGLSIVKDIVKKYHGEMQIEEKADSFEVKVVLPDKGAKYRGESSKI